jgi:NADH-quinone oxidoreductase subunit H
MMQDRIGPNRAVLCCRPSPCAGVVLAAALLVAGGGGGMGRASRSAGRPAAHRAAFGFAHAAVVVSWVTGALIARYVAAPWRQLELRRLLAWIGGARRILAAGLVAHVAVRAAGLRCGARIPPPAAGVRLRGGSLRVRGVPGVRPRVRAAYVLQPRRRVGNRLAGLLHPAADGLKTLFKEDFVPPNADRFLHGLAPVVSVLPPLVLLAVVPFGDTLCLAPDAGGELDWTSLLSPLGPCRPTGLRTGAVRLQAVDFERRAAHVSPWVAPPSWAPRWRAGRATTSIASSAACARRAR